MAIKEFISTRRSFVGKITQELLSLMDVSINTLVDLYIIGTIFVKTSLRDHNTEIQVLIINIYIAINCGSKRIFSTCPL